MKVMVLQYQICLGTQLKDNILKFTNRSSTIYYNIDIKQELNLDMKIVYTKVKLDNKEYKISIPQQAYFMVYCAVPIKTQILYPNVNNIKLYNKNDIDITNEIL